MSWVCLSGNKDVRARKPHICFCCAEIISEGAIYTRRSGCEPGEGFTTMKMHPECEKATTHWENDDWEIFSGSKLKRGTDEVK